MILTLNVMLFFLTEETGRTVALGIGKDLFYRWRREQSVRQGLAFPGNGRGTLTLQQQKIRELEKKLKDKEMERDLLKNAIVDSIDECNTPIVQRVKEVAHYELEWWDNRKAA